jgi:hypothetical protein
MYGQCQDQTFLQNKALVEHVMGYDWAMMKLEHHFFYYERG